MGLTKKMKMRRMQASKEEELKVGLFYRNVARRYFERELPGVKEYENILTRGNLAEIESFVVIKPLLQAMVDELRRQLAESKIRLPGDFLGVVTYSEEPESEAEEIAIEIGMREYTEDEKAVILLQTLRVIHDEWVRVHSEKFFDDDVKQKCQFLQFELLGPEAIDKYLIFTEDVFKMFGLDVDKAKLIKCYWPMQKKFLEEKEIVSRDDLVDYIMQADYNPLSRDISDILRTNRAVAELMADN